MGRASRRAKERRVFVGKGGRRPITGGAIGVREMAREYRVAPEFNIDTGSCWWCFEDLGGREDGLVLVVAGGEARVMHAECERERRPCRLHEVDPTHVCGSGGRRD